MTAQEGGSAASAGTPEPQTSAVITRSDDDYDPEPGRQEGCGEPAGGPHSKQKTLPGHPSRGPPARAPARGRDREDRRHRYPAPGIPAPAGGSGVRPARPVRYDRPLSPEVAVA